MKPLPSTAIRENRDGRAWDGRTIEEPPALRRSTWIMQCLFVGFFALMGFSMCSLP